MTLLIEVQKEPIRTQRDTASTLNSTLPGCLGYFLVCWSGDGHVTLSFDSKMVASPISKCAHVHHDNQTLLIVLLSYLPGKSPWQNVYGKTNICCCSARIQDKFGSAAEVPASKVTNSQRAFWRHFTQSNPCNDCMCTCSTKTSSYFFLNTLILVNTKSRILCIILVVQVDPDTQ